MNSFHIILCAILLTVTYQKQSNNSIKQQIYLLKYIFSKAFPDCLLLKFMIPSYYFLYIYFYFLYTVANKL